MATSYIPKIEWLRETQTGDTSTGTDTILNIPSTDTLQVGMVIEGAGIPTGTTILSKTINSVTMSADATATATTVSIDYVFILEFDFPNRKDPFGQEIRHQGRATVSKSGKVQVLTDYIQENFSLTVSFLSQSKKEELENFLITHAVLGKSFSYFTDKGDSATEETYALDPRALLAQFKVLTKKGAGFLWETKLKLRRVL